MFIENIKKYQNIKYLPYKKIQSQSHRNTVVNEEKAWSTKQI